MISRQKKKMDFFLFLLLIKYAFVYKNLFIFARWRQTDSRYIHTHTHTQIHQTSIICRLALIAVLPTTCSVFVLFRCPHRSVHFQIFPVWNFFIFLSANVIYMLYMIFVHYWTLYFPVHQKKKKVSSLLTVICI